MIGVGVRYSGVKFNMAEKSQKTSKGLEKNKYSNSVNRTTSESLRLGDSDKSINHPTSLISSATNAKKKTSFQITSVTVGSRTSNDGGDDSADDLDESHTEDISDVIDVSRVTDIENETPSYSEDTFSKDDVFFNTSASLGTAPVIPTSSQYGLAIVDANENCGNSPSTCVNNISGSELHVTVPDSVINLVGVKHNETEMRDIHSHPGRNERFKVVKIESTEPFKRGRWICMDYLDHSMIQSQQTQANVSNLPVKEQIDNAHSPATVGHQATDSGICMSEMPQNMNSVEDKVPLNVDKGTQQDQQSTVQYINQNSGQTNTGAYSNPSPGQTMQSQPVSISSSQAQMLAQHMQSMSLSTPMNQNMLNTNQHQSLQAQQMQQVIASANMQMPQVPLAQQLPQTVQMQHMQQFQQPQQVQQQVIQPMQPVHSIQSQTMQVPQTIIQTIPQQPISAPANYPPTSAHIPQTIQMPVQNQPSPQSYPAAANLQQCPPGMSQQMISVQQHPMQPPQYYTTQGISMMPSQQQQPQMMTIPTQVAHQQSTVTMQQPYPVQSIPQQQQPPPQQQQQQQQQQSQAQSQAQNQQQQQQQQIPIGHSTSLHHVPASSVTTSMAGYAPMTGVPTAAQVVAAVSQAASMVPTSQSAATQMIQQMYGTVMQGQMFRNGNVPSSVVDAITSEPGVIERVVQSTGILETLANVASINHENSEAPATGEDPESLAGLARALAHGSCTNLVQLDRRIVREPSPTSSTSGASAVAIDNKIEQAMDLVKSHLMFAVREEVEVLKEKIAELMDRINHLEFENSFLKANASQETLAQLSSMPQPPSSSGAP